MLKLDFVNTTCAFNFTQVAKPQRPVVTNSTTHKIRDNNKKTTNLNVASLRKSLETPVKVDANPIQC